MSARILPETAAAPDRDDISATLGALNCVILGKSAQLKLALACVLARGHLLIEDVPGVGKTTLARSLAGTLGLGYKRIQFTSDMLPADIIGVSVYRRDDDRFEFHPGPVFSELVLADEVNRATPKAQSALLEAMQEGQVSVDGRTYDLPKPFFVVATQNPSEQSGTFALPESQLDRFLMRIELGYPGEAEERALLRGQDSDQLLSAATPILSAQQIIALQASTDEVLISEPMLDYIQAIVRFTRESTSFDCGLSPRGAIALRQAARALALIEGRNAIYPDDIQAVVPAVVGHRLRGNSQQGGPGPAEAGQHVVESVQIP